MSAPDDLENLHADMTEACENGTCSHPECRDDLCPECGCGKEPDRSVCDCCAENPIIAGEYDHDGTGGSA